MKKDIAFFDFDGTITKSDTFTPFIHYSSMGLKYLRIKKIALTPYILLYKLGILSGATIRKKVVSVAFKKRAEDELKRIALKYSIDSIPPIVMDNAMKAIEWHKSLGNKVVIVSASIDIYLHPWCKLNGLEVLCSEMEFKDGKATGRYLNGDCSGKLKKLAIINNYDLTDYKEIYAYGDTKEDLEMLSIATKKIYQWEDIS